MVIEIGLVLAVAACPSVGSPDPALCPEDENVDRACERFDNSEECARQVELCRLKEAPPWVRRDGPTLRLELAGARVLTLTDRLPLPALVDLPKPRGEGDIWSWQFREYNAAADAFVVHAQYHEAIGWVVIRRKDGVAFGFRDKPWFSPSGKTLLTAGGWGTWGSRKATWWSDLDAVPRALEEMDVGGREPDGESGWTVLIAPVAWRDEATVDVIVLENTRREGRWEIGRIPGRLVRTNDAWQLSWPAPEEAITFTSAPVVQE